MNKKIRKFLFTGHCLLFTVFFYSCASAPTAEDLKNAEVHYKIGMSHWTEQKLHDASIEFQKAINLNPKDKYALNALGLLSTEFEKYEEAVSYYKRAIAIDPDYSNAMNNLGATYVRMQKWDEAINYFKAALTNPLYTTPEMAYSNMGWAFYNQNDYISAADALKKAILRNPDIPRANYILGLVYVKLGEDNKALEQFKKAVSVASDYTDAHWELANAYLRDGDNEKALRHFNAVVNSGGNDAKVRQAQQYIEQLK
ncbi:MAG: tetratricopeptide repeat protein [Nitrospirae bacterium]|nr:tetratricopeptide repeat protein [Nitrospirota bacterium]